MYEYRAKLIKVIDGDTVDAMVDCGFSMFRAERIRLRGINTPEVRTRDKEEKKKGLAAKARLQELIEENKNNEFMLQTFFDKKGKYGRLLGVLYTPIEGSEKMLGLSYVKKNGGLPDNFVFTCSRGGKYDNLIPSTMTKSARVFFSQEEAKALDLDIDHTDDFAISGKNDFALVIHGSQPAGTSASKALQALKKKGFTGYGKKSKIWKVCG